MVDVPREISRAGKKMEVPEITRCAATHLEGGQKSGQLRFANLIGLRHHGA